MDYEELEYIQGDGSQYLFHADFQHVAGYVYEIDFVLETVENDKWLFSTPASTTHDNCVALNCYVYTGQLNAIYGASCDPFRNDSIVPVAGERYHVLLTPSDLYINEERVCTPHTWRFNDSEVEPGLAIFGLRNLDGTFPLRHSPSMRLYYMRVMDADDTLVAEMRPARRLTDNAIGMYDVVRKQFLENIGIGAFVAGEPTGRYF